MFSSPHYGALEALLAVLVIELDANRGLVLVDEGEGPVRPVPAPDRVAVLHGVGGLDIALVLLLALLSLVALPSSDLVSGSTEDVRRAQAVERSRRGDSAEREVVVVHHVDVVERAAGRSVDDVELPIDLRFIEE